MWDAGGCTVRLAVTDGRGQKTTAVWTQEDVAAGLGDADDRWRSSAGVTLARIEI